MNASCEGEADHRGSPASDTARVIDGKRMRNFTDSLWQVPPKLHEPGFAPQPNHCQQVAVRLNGKRFEASLIELARPARFVMSMATHCGHDSEATKKLTHLIAGLGPDHKMPVIGEYHQRISPPEWHGPTVFVALSHQKCPLEDGRNSEHGTILRLRRFWFFGMWYLSAAFNFTCGKSAIDFGVPVACRRHRQVANCHAKAAPPHEKAALRCRTPCLQGLELQVYCN